MLIHTHLNRSILQLRHLNTDDKTHDIKERNISNHPFALEKPDSEMFDSTRSHL